MCSQVYLMCVQHTCDYPSTQSPFQAGLESEVKRKGARPWARGWGLGANSSHVPAQNFKEFKAFKSKTGLQTMLKVYLSRHKLECIPLNILG